MMHTEVTGLDRETNKVDLYTLALQSLLLDRKKVSSHSLFHTKLGSAGCWWEKILWMTLTIQCEARLAMTDF